MKNTRWKNIIRGIRGNLNRFLSILFIVALGAGFMAGLAAASPDMYDSADQYIRDYHLFDLDIKSVIGFSEQNTEAVKHSGIAGEVQSAVVMDMVLDQKDGSDFTSRVYGILDENGSTNLNQIHLIQGRYPENPSECIVESVFGRYSGDSVSEGDILMLAESNSDYETLSGYMESTELTIVGICESPMCISIEGDVSNVGNGTINLNVYVRNDFFTCDFATDLFLSFTESSEYNTFDEEYRSMISEKIEQLTPLAKEQAAIRADEVQDTMSDTVDTLKALLSQVQAAAEIQNTLSGDTLVRTEQTEKVSELLKDTAAGSLLEESLRLTQGKEDAGVSSSASVLYDRLSEQLDEAEESLSSLSKSSWIFRTRKDSSGFNSYLENVGKVSALAKIFPVFFFLVALLVALTTMTRLVEENRLQIGTLKALGYSNGQILLEYMLFSFSASLAGCILGFGIGFRIFPFAINAAYSMMYVLPPMPTPVRWDIVAWVSPVTICSILLATLWSCWNEFRSVPGRLMQPKAPQPGKRIWLEHIGFIWKRLSFTLKVTFRNLFRYKKRFIMTIIGVAGCSALLLTGFGIKDSVNDIIDKQFGEIYRYDILFATDQKGTVSENEPLREKLDQSDQIQLYTSASQETGSLYFKNEKQDLTFFIPQDLTLFPEFISLRSRTGPETYELTSEGIILTEKICEEMHIKKGDTVTLENSDGIQASFQVLAITENYVSSFVYMTADLYETSFSAEPVFQSLICILEDGENANEKVMADILSDPHVLYGRSVQNLKDSFSDSIRSINGVIYVLILAAGLLCIVVLYNLTNVNICERRKELATLRVLGFYKKETQHYIFRETNILSFLGALAGLVLGIWLHQFVVRTVEVNHIMFGREIKPLSYIIALAISVVFTILVNIIMKRPINKTDMVEAMKAND